MLLLLLLLQKNGESDSVDVDDGDGDSAVVIEDDAHSPTPCKGGAEEATSPKQQVTFTEFLPGFHVKCRLLTDHFFKPYCITITQLLSRSTDSDPEQH